ncbi:response regulator transcription factor [Synechococcus sp. CBW1002]|jgi:two-component system response regulator DevR|uniref:response regulator transcription factor n=1 Tax=Synechococcus sp. CBW1002 TaxID=1353134 RepID=UPI0018CD7725|nr:response regulator transcription factor [Synechococcus sp. CBW1002]QPN60506.1 response regulator transcription factor [Synechococcus sp. CBW1002]
MGTPEHEGGDRSLALLQARGDLLRVLLRPHPVLVCMYPRLLMLSIQSGLRAQTAAPGLRITASLSEADALVREADRPQLILVTELLADGPGLDLIRLAKAQTLAHRCLLVLTHNRRALVEAAIEAGTDVIVLEGSIGQGGAFVYGVERLCRGEIFVDPAIRASLETGEESPEAPAPDAGSGRCTLSPRELSILALVAQGLSNKEIGARLHIAPSTARDHVRNILRRLSVTNRAAAAVEAFRLGYLR